MAKSLEALVQGEIMQLKSTAEERLSMEYYLTKSYCKTASLMAFSCKSSALLSGYDIKDSVTIAAEKFGYHFGLAFQVRWGSHRMLSRALPQGKSLRRSSTTCLISLPTPTLLASRDCKTWRSASLPPQCFTLQKSGQNSRVRAH